MRVRQTTFMAGAGWIYSPRWEEAPRLLRLRLLQPQRRPPLPPRRLLLDPRQHQDSNQHRGRVLHLGRGPESPYRKQEQALPAQVLTCSLEANPGFQSGAVVPRRGTFCGLQSMYLDEHAGCKAQNSVDRFSANQVKGRSSLGAKGRRYHEQEPNPYRYAPAVLTLNHTIQ